MKTMSPDCLDGIPQALRVGDVRKTRAQSRGGGYQVLNGTVSRPGPTINRKLNIRSGWIHMPRAHHLQELLAPGRNILPGIKFYQRWEEHDSERERLETGTSTANTDIKSEEIINENEYVLPEITRKLNSRATYTMLWTASTQCFGR